MRFFSFFLSLLFTTVSLTTSAQIYDRFQAEEFKQGKNKLKYRFLSPQKVEADQTYPLLIFLHGAGERGNDNRRQLIHVGR